MAEAKSQSAPHIFVCTPCYGGVITASCSESMRKLTMLCLSRGVKLTFASVTTESLITRARNFFVAAFLGHPEYTHLMFIDADITFDPESVFHMLSADKQVVGGCYPIKALFLDRVREVLLKDREVPLNEVLAKTFNYAYNLKTFGLTTAGTKLMVKVQNGLMPVDEIATGFLLIRRDVLETMKRKYPEKAYVNDMAGYTSAETSGNFYNFFECSIHPESRRYLSEDYSFCLMCRELGIPVFADLTADLTHTGVFNFCGSVSKSIQFMQVPQSESEKVRA
jgi:hypothetical protein